MVLRDRVGVGSGELFDDRGQLLEGDLVPPLGGVLGAPLAEDLGDGEGKVAVVLLHAPEDLQARRGGDLGHVGGQVNVAAAGRGVLDVRALVIQHDFLHVRANEVEIGALHFDNWH